VEFDYHICGRGFIGCPGDATEYARWLDQLWVELPVSGAKPTLYHWHKHYDPYAGTSAVGSQYRIERTGNPSVNPVFILFAQIIGTPVRPPPEGWDKLRAWLDGNGWNFIALLGEERFRDADAVPDGTIPLTGTMFELFDALRTGDKTHLVVYDLSRFAEPPSPGTPEHQRQRAWRDRLIAELGKTYTVRQPEDREEFERRATKDLKAAFCLPTLDPLDSPLPNLAAVGVDEPLLFGRDALIEKLSRRILERGATFTRVLGVSGAGKSSLLRAGLMGSWFDRSRGQAGLLAKATALLIEPLQLRALDPDPLRAVGLLLSGAFTGRDTGAVGPSPQGITATLADLPPISGNRAVDVQAARAWWEEFADAFDGPVVLILDQAEQIDRQAKREARERIDRDSTLDSTPFLTPAWRRFVDLITSLAGVADPILDAPLFLDAPTRFRLVLGLHRESAIDLWGCDKATLLANPPIEVPPLTDWRTLIQNTIKMYGLEPDEPLLASMATEAEALANERQPLHIDEKIADDTRYDRASVLPLVKAALWRLISAWRQRAARHAAAEPREIDKTLKFSKFGAFAGIADSVDALGEAAIALWIRALSEGWELRGLFEREAFVRECNRRFDHLFTGLIDVSEKGRPELSYIRRDGELARAEKLLLSALGSAELLAGPDADHWRLPHRTVIANWPRGRKFIARYEARLATKRRLVLAYQSGASAAAWDEHDITPFINLAFGWIGSDEGEDAELHHYNRGGLTARFSPERFRIDAEEALDCLPVRVMASGQNDWAARLFERAMEDQSWDRKRGVWTLVAAAYGRLDWLKRIFAPVPPSLRRHIANHIDRESGNFPLFLASQEGYTSCVTLLLDEGAEPNQVNEVGASPLLQAAQNGRDDCVSLLLDKGAEPNRIDNRGASPLLMAAHTGHAVCVGLLLSSGADPNLAGPLGTLPLHQAARNGHTECVRLLLYNGAEPNQIDEEEASPLLGAAHNGHSDCVRLLLDKGADPNRIDNEGGFPLLVAAQEGHAVCVNLLLDKGAEPNQINDKADTFPLFIAAKRGHGDCIGLLLDNGADPNQVNTAGNSALLLASQNGHFGCVSLLLKRGADPNQINEEGASALLQAALHGRTDCVSLLLEKGAVPYQNNDKTGGFPLLVAAQNGHTDCVTLLLKKGADPNQINDEGVSALLAASERGNADCVSGLLEGGADPNRINDLGTFPLLKAAENGHTVCVRLLLEGGADSNQSNDHGLFPLLQAAMLGRAGCVNSLLKKGADPNQVNLKTSSFPLFQAAEHGHSNCVGLLLDGGADPNQINDKGGFALIAAVSHGHVECTGVLLDKGAEPNKIHLPSGFTALTLALEEGNWPILRILGQIPAVIDSALPEARQLIEHLIAHPDLRPDSPEDEPVVATPPGVGSRALEIVLPVSPGRPVQHGRNPSVWNSLGVRPDAVEPTTVNRETWRLNRRGDAIISVRFCLADVRSEVQALIFDISPFERLVPCDPGFDFNAFAHSLKNAGRPLENETPQDIGLWASLLLIYRYGGTPVLPEGPWPLVPGAVLPRSLTREEDWRRWEFAHTVTGPTVTLPFLLNGHLLRAPILVPEDGIGADVVGDPEVIMSGLDYPGPRFISFSEGGPVTGLWLVKEIGRD
jgi:ankyrin repeat protein